MKWLLAKFGLAVVAGNVVAQLPPIPQPPPIQPESRFPTPNQFPSGVPQPPNALPPMPPGYPVRPTLPGPPGLRPPGSLGNFNTTPLGQNPVAQPQEIPLPQPENKFPLNARDLTLKRAVGGWQIWNGYQMLRDFGDRENDARDAFRVYRDLRPTEWITIGTPKPVVEYGLANGRPTGVVVNAATEDANNPNNPNNANGGPAINFAGGPAASGAGAKLVVPIDLRSVRVEPVRGVWCLRDDANIHFNFGPVKGDAEQALAVVKRYGFNRIGVVGQPTPVMTYFFVGEGELPIDKGPFARAALQQQIDSMNRVGIPVPGLGFVGEMIRVDPRKLDIRKEGAEWVVTSGTEALGRFGPSEWAARDAARTLGDARFTEFCKVGSGGLTFFLVNGKAPTRVPLSAQGRRFDPGALKVQQYGAAWAITENGRHLYDCATAEEGEILIRVIKSFGFDQLCHIGPSAKLGVSFLAKGQ